MIIHKSLSTAAAPFWICPKDGCGGFCWGYFDEKEKEASK